MKILQINKFYYLKGGSERYFFDLIGLLKSKGHEVIPFAMQDEKNLPSKYAKYFVGNVSFDKSFINPFQIIYSLEARQKLEALIKKTKPDVAHLHNIAHQISPSILHALKKHKIPVVQTLHDYKLICPNYRLFTKGKVCERCKKHRYYNAKLHKCLKNSYLASALACAEMYVHWLMGIYKNNVHKFIAPSEFMKDKCVEFGVDAKQIIAIPHPIDVKKFRPDYNFNKKNKYIIYVGRLSEEKGVETLIKAMKGIKDVKLKIVGTGLESKGLKVLGKRLPIEFVGFKQGRQLYDLIRGAMFVVVPSIWYEVFGLVVLEAFALGKPVLAARIGGLPELVQEEKTGWLFEPGNVKELNQKIIKILDKSEKIDRIGKQARNFVEVNFSPEEHYEKLMQLYHQ